METLFIIFILNGISKASFITHGYDDFGRHPAVIGFHAITVKSTLPLSTIL